MMHQFFKNLVFSLAVAFVGAGASAQTSEKLGTFLNGEAITKDDLSAYVERRIDLRGAVRNAYGVESVLGEMALTRALSMEGESKGVPRRNGKEGDRFDDVYGQAIYQTLLPSCKRPDDPVAIRKYFDEHPDAFRVPPTARLSRVMLPKAASIEGLPASEWMLQRAQSISSKVETFEEAALRAEKVNGLDPQGDLGWVTLTEDLAIMRALASASQGEMIGPVQEGDFVYLFLVMQKREARQLAWDEAAAGVPQRAETYCRQKANENIKDAMLKKYGFKPDQAAIKAMFDKK
ncbi:peptidyl-prolyl cis-trans isomerase [Simplicispira piscis]|jgi:hypothetical protein